LLLDDLATLLVFYCTCFSRVCKPRALCQNPDFGLYAKPGFWVPVILTTPYSESEGLWILATMPHLIG